MIRPAFVLFTLLMVFITPLHAQQTNEMPPIRVGSTTLTEDMIMGQIILVALEEAGYEVVDLNGYGDLIETRQAVVEREIDIYLEYAGTALSNFFGGIFNEDSSAFDSEAVYGAVSSYDSAFNDLVWLQPAPLNNSYLLAVNEAFASEHNVYTMSAFAEYVNNGGFVMLATDNEFYTVPDGLQAMEKAYGFDITGAQTLVIGDVDEALLAEVLKSDSNNVNVATSGTVNAYVDVYDFVLLEDDLELLIPYEPAPVIHGDLLRQNPQIVTILNPIFFAIDEATLRHLNHEVQINGRDPQEVAREFVTELNNTTP